MTPQQEEELAWNVFRITLLIAMGVMIGLIIGMILILAMDMVRGY